jgi:hypothetical protein
MYYITNRKLTKNIALFIKTCCNQSIKGAGFGYGKGLIGTRMRKRRILLPISNNQPDWDFMEQYIKERQEQIINEYKSFVNNRLQNI